MSLYLPSRQLGRSALQFARRPHQARTIFSWFKFQKKTTTPSDPMSTDYTKRRPSTALPSSTPATQSPGSGDLDSSSIFADTVPSSSTSTDSTTSAPTFRRRDPALMSTALDPRPRARRRWERKILIRSLRTRYRLNKTTRILRTERSSLSKSPMYPTSIKKLGPLARQIAGKPIDDAIVQMRFSKKKVAADVLKHLEYARDEAVVRRGMGLGAVANVGETGQQGQEARKLEEVVIVDKKGKKRVVKDRTQIYVDQAWVGRGSYGLKPDYRARGMVGRMRPPTTSITILLKEEATRIRLAEEREQKRQRRKVWVPLPDRPITAQRQYCMW